MDRAHLLNRLVNKPGIVEFVAPGYFNVDLSKAALDPRNVIYGDIDGAILFVYIAPQCYGMHYLLTRKRRGKKALSFCRRALNHMFTQFGALAIVGSTPADNLPARVMNNALGGKPVGVSVDSLGRSCVDYVLDRDTWEALSAVFLAG